jgi:head-tail adaptor
MRSPQLICPISIQSQTTTQDAFGQPVNAWTEIVSCFADIDIQNSALIYSTAEFMEKIVYRITIPWSPTVFAPNMRIVYLDAATNVTHTYNIEAILNPKQGNVWLTFLCYELDGSQ